jgi:hypothetical protein
VTFFLDNCLSVKIGKALRALDQDVRILKEIYPPDTLDSTWMPLVAEENWIAVTDDNYILRRPAERKLLVRLKLRAVFLPGPFANLGMWQQVVKIGSWWPDILEACADLQPGACLQVKMKSGKVVPVQF